MDARSRALEALRRVGPRARATDVARYLGVTVNYARSLLLGLERRGLAEAVLTNGGYLEWKVAR